MEVLVGLIWAYSNAKDIAFRRKSEDTFETLGEKKCLLIRTEWKTASIIPGDLLSQNFPSRKFPIKWSFFFLSESRGTVNCVGRKTRGPTLPPGWEAVPTRGTEPLVTPLPEQQVRLSVGCMDCLPRRSLLPPSSNLVTKTLPPSSEEAEQLHKTCLVWMHSTMNLYPPSLQHWYFKTYSTLNVKLLFKFQGFW